MDNFGKKERRNPDWFESGIIVLELAVTAKCSAMLDYKARNDALALCLTNGYWLNLCQSIQISYDSGNIGAMYEDIKKAFGPSIIKVAPLRPVTDATLTDRGKQMKRWAEYYQKLYSRENTCLNLPVCHARGQHSTLHRRAQESHPHPGSW